MPFFQNKKRPSFQKPSKPVPFWQRAKKQPTERVCVYMDGGNFYFSLREMHLADMNFDFRGFVTLIAKGRKVSSVRYYIAEIIPQEGNEKSLELHRLQQMLFEKLTKAGFTLIKGTLRKIGDEYTEKGVDVRMAIDLVEGAYEDKYDTALLITSDADMAPAVEMARRKNKKVEVIAFSHKKVDALEAAATQYLEPRREDLKKLIPKKTSSRISKPKKAATPVVSKPPILRLPTPQPPFAPKIKPPEPPVFF